MHNTLILLPLAAYILLTLIFTRRVSARGMAEALIKGHVLLFTFIVLSTEILSSIDRITYPFMLAAWLFFLLVCFIIVFRRGIGRRFSLPVLQKMPPVTMIYVGIIAIILVATLATAILYPPNTWDSMTYHMSRVVHWISNNNVSFYPTWIIRQNFMAPLAEFAIMHVQILTGSDLYANLVQWISFPVLICLGFLIAVELGLSNRQQWISVIIVVTIPMAILQASSTQTDLVVSSFLMSFTLFMCRLRNNLSTQNLLLAAISLGLALLTKGTAFIYGAAIGISLAAPVLIDRRHDCRRFLKATAALSCVVLIALSLNAGHFWRNYNLYGHPLSTATGSTRHQEISVAVLVSNILRNGALHLNTPSNLVNQYEYRALKALLGPELNNPKTTFYPTSFVIPDYNRDEDKAGNLIHMLIALLGVVLLPIAWCKGHYRRVIWYSFSVLLGVILYSLTLKWQPWASRLHMPIFALAAPLLAITITSGVGLLRKRIEYVIILFMVLYSFPFALSSDARSLVSLDWMQYDRKQLYFIKRKSAFHDYNSAMNVLADADHGEVGLYLGGDDWEYPFWAFAERTGKNGRTTTFRHVGVSNNSGTITEEVFLPQYIIATKPIWAWEYASKYDRIYFSRTVRVFRKSRHKQ